MIYITRRECFNAAHKLWNEAWSNEKNQAVFGKCANQNWHGHNFQLFVTVKGHVKEDTGFVMDLKVLSDIIKEEVIEHLDHKNLNLDVPFLKGKMASTENIIKVIWERLEAPIAKHDATLHALKLTETENNFVEYYGE